MLNAHAVPLNFQNLYQPSQACAGWQLLAELLLVFLSLCLILSPLPEAFQIANYASWTPATLHDHLWDAKYPTTTSTSLHAPFISADCACRTSASLHEALQDANSGCKILTSLPSRVFAIS